MIFTKYQDIIEKISVKQKLHFFTKKNLPKYIFNGRKPGREGGEMVPVKRSFTTFNGGKSLIPGRIILQILTMRNSFQDLPPSSKNSNRLCNSRFRITP